MRYAHVTRAFALVTLASAPSHAQAPAAPPPLPSITLPAELDRVLYVAVALIWLVPDPRIERRLSK